MSKPVYLHPPLPHNPFGKERRVGVEFEFTGIEMEQTAELIIELYGGETRELSTFEFEINNTELGRFKLELDSSLFLDKKYEDSLKKLGIDLSELRQKKEIEGKLRELASSVVPFEIISPPIPFSELNRLEKLIGMLREKKAKGTRDKLIYAFGLHLNPESAANDPKSILNVTRAFILMEPWIRKTADIDLSRRLTPFINEYGKKYKEHVLNESYTPNTEQLIIDYIDFGNTRNQSLDLLPLFEFLNQDLVKNKLDDGLTSARPTFHYRLPDCDLGNSGWSLAEEWNRWVWVERMSVSERRNQYARKYKELMLDNIIPSEKKWVELIQRWTENE